MNTKLTDAILDIVVRFGEDDSSLSFVKQELRGKGWKGLGNNSNFETLVEECGFTLRRVYAKNSSNVRATYINV